MPCVRETVHGASLHLILTNIEMKRYFYESMIADILLCLSSCSTIAIGPFVFFKRGKDDVFQYSKNHETVHAVQWTEVTAIFGLIIFVMQLVFGFSAWWYLLAPVAYYVWYVLEWLVKLVILQDSNSAYKSICFEMEAYKNQRDDNYIENRRMVTPWLNEVFHTVIG